MNFRDLPASVRLLLRLQVRASVPSFVHRFWESTRGSSRFHGRRFTIRVISQVPTNMYTFVKEIHKYIIFLGPGHVVFIYFNGIECYLVWKDQLESYFSIVQLGWILCSSITKVC